METSWRWRRHCDAADGSIQLLYEKFEPDGGSALRVWSPGEWTSCKGEEVWRGAEAAEGYLAR